MHTAAGQNLDASKGHEDRDANIPAALWFGAALIATIIVVLLLMRWTFYAFPTPQAEAGLGPYTRGVAAELPPEPRLQVHAPEDLKKLREQEDSMLTSYGWVDKQNGIVRIPVERAMELLARRNAEERVQNASKLPGK